MMSQQVYITPMLNIPWGASNFVSIFLSSIQTQQNWTAIIAISRITSNKEKSRQTTISERYKCASTRIGISSRNVTLNRYSKHKLMFTMWQICLVFKICEQILQSWIRISHTSPTEICVELFLTHFWHFSNKISDMRNSDYTHTETTWCRNSADSFIGLLSPHMQKVVIHKLVFSKIFNS